MGKITQRDPPATATQHTTTPRRPRRRERGDVTQTMEAPDESTVEARRQREVTYMSLINI